MRIEDSGGLLLIFSHPLSVLRFKAWIQGLGLGFQILGSGLLFRVQGLGLGSGLKV